MQAMRIACALSIVALFVAGCATQELEPTPGLSMAIRVDRQPWRDENSSGQVLTTRNYRIYTTSTNRMILKYLPGYMEAAYSNYLQLTGMSDRPQAQPMPIYMMASRKQWATLTKNVLKAQQNIVLSLEAGGYCYKGVCVFWDLGGLGTFSVAAHEGLHQFLHYRLKDRLPMWLEEGLCASAEGYELNGREVRFTPNRNSSRYGALRKGILNEYWVPLAQLLPMDAGDAIVKSTERAVSYYGQLWAMSVFLRTHPVYGDGFRRLLAAAAAGNIQQELNVPPALWRTLRGRTYNRTVSTPLFQHFITRDLEGFEREYRAFARKLVGLE